MSVARSQRFPSSFALGLGLTALTLAGCSEQAAQQPPPPAASVTVAEPTKKVVTDYDDYVGRFAAVDLIQVYARVSGYLEKIAFTDGQIVKQGDLLFSIDKRPFQVALELAQANLAKSQADLDFATSDLQRATTLLQDKNSTAISKQTFDQRQQTERSASAQLAASQASVRAAQLDLEFTDLKSPVTGRIGDRRVAIGNLVTGGQGGANTNTLLATIVSIDPIYFDFTFDEASYIRYQRMAGRIGANNTVPVQLELIDETGFPHKGTMDFVDNAISETTGTIRGRAKFANPTAQFTPGMFGRIRVPSSEPHEALVVPDEAIGTEQTRKFVYVMGPGTEPQAPKMKYVTLGRLFEGQRVVTKGLDATDRVVVNGLTRIRPGVKVVAKEEQPAATAPAAPSASDAPKPDATKADTAAPKPADASTAAPKAAAPNPATPSTTAPKTDASKPATAN